MPRTTRRRRTPRIAQLRVTLLGIEPPIWRRLLVPYDIPLATLHRALLTCMGWQGYHLHAFEVGKIRYGEPDDEFPDGTVAYDSVTLRDIAPAPGARFAYQYDFGDDWQHEVVLENTLRLNRSARVPYCLDGARACPPEDVGGVGGFEDFLAALANPGHPEHQEYVTWVGEEYDPEAFHPRCVNLELFRITATDERFWGLLPK
ncbi:MAG: plasmid pRiA4b ORF-3 family protein [Gemmatimonadetes bacterium]|nr:plasmid pRiA4b ORF-3 family protein [Gemmatimonadota bacterium]